jgi:hypothetical protein
MYRFRVHRTSDGFKYDQPIPEAVKIVDEYMELDMDWWYEFSPWMIEVSSLEELMNLTAKYGGIVVHPIHEWDENGSLYSGYIEIYDYYRE